MVVPAAASDRSDRGLLSPVVQRLAAVVSSATLALLFLLALWLLARRAGGGLRQPLSPLALAAVAAILSSVMWVTRLLWYHAQLRHQPWGPGAASQWAIPSLVVLLLAVALSLDGTGSLPLTCFWIALMAVEGTWWWFAWRRGLATKASRSDGPGEPHPEPAPLEEATAPRAPRLEIVEHADLEEPLADDVCQQITRSRAAQRDDTVTGLLRACFEPRQRSHSLHVAFCPPMLHRPDVTFIQLSGSRARIKAAEAQTFGIRFDLRLAAASDATQVVVIHFEAHCGKPESVGLGGMET